MPMSAAPQLGVASYKPDTISQVQSRGMSMMVSGETAVPYGAVMPQLTALQVSVLISNTLLIIVMYGKFLSRDNHGSVSIDDYC